MNVPSLEEIQEMLEEMVEEGEITKRWSEERGEFVYKFVKQDLEIN